MSKTIDVTFDSEINSGNPVVGNKPGAWIVPKTGAMLTDVLQSNINELINSVVEIFDGCDVNSSNYEIGDIVFNISINAESKVSILSVVGGGVSANTGINIHLRRKSGKG